MPTDKTYLYELWQKVCIEVFWKTAQDGEAGVNAVYGSFYRIGGYARWIHFNFDLRSDEGYSGAHGWNYRTGRSSS